MKLFMKKNLPAQESEKKEARETNANARIKILGTGCAKCEQLQRLTMEALKELQINEPVEHVTNFTEIASYGVMSTPAFVLDEEILFLGKIPSSEELKQLLQEKL